MTVIIGHSYPQLQLLVIDGESLTMPTTRADKSSEYHWTNVGQQSLDKSYQSMSCGQNSLNSFVLNMNVNDRSKQNKVTVSSGFSYISKNDINSKENNLLMITKHCYNCSFTNKKQVYFMSPNCGQTSCALLSFKCLVVYDALL